MPLVRSNAPMVELSRAIVSARSIPGMSVTQVPSRVRGLGMPVSGSAPTAAINRGMSAPWMETVRWWRAAALSENEKWLSERWRSHSYRTLYVWANGVEPPVGFVMSHACTQREQKHLSSLSRV